MTRYERIMAMKGVPFPVTIIDYQEQFPCRDIYVSDKIYIELLKYLGVQYHLASDVLKNGQTETRIYRSFRVPDYTAYAIRR